MMGECAAKALVALWERKQGCWSGHEKKASQRGLTGGGGGGAQRKRDARGSERGGGGKVNGKSGGREKASGTCDT